MPSVLVGRINTYAYMRSNPLKNVDQEELQVAVPVPVAIPTPLVHTPDHRTRSFREQGSDVSRLRRQPHAGTGLASFRTRLRAYGGVHRQ